LAILHHQLYTVLPVFLKGQCWSPSFLNKRFSCLPYCTIIAQQNADDILLSIALSVLQPHYGIQRLFSLSLLMVFHKRPLNTSKSNSIHFSTHHRLRNLHSDTYVQRRRCKKARGPVPLPPQLKVRPPWSASFCDCINAYLLLTGSPE
jgi:hypothetical protein